MRGTAVGQKFNDGEGNSDERRDEGTEPVVILELLAHVLKLARDTEQAQMAAQIEKAYRRCAAIFAGSSDFPDGDVKPDGPCN
jgi:hypothetical protein